jgi:catechol 2,3-dioxygenase-like lactoylglutathione lyase family enzyme
MILRPSHVMLYTTDLDRAIAWYCTHLGFTVTYQAGPHYASLQHEHMGRLDLHPSGTDTLEARHGAQPGYVVDDLEAVVESLRAKGIRVNDIQQMGDSPKHTWFWDSDDNSLGIGEA